MKRAEASARFIELIRKPERLIRLDLGALLIAAHAYPDLEVDRELARLDDLATRCRTPTLDALVMHLFVVERFVGNRSDYYDPRNSFLNDVLDRRRGIPITLSLLTIEVGRRIGVPLSGVGMPGHFLLRDKVDRSVFVDPFSGGATLTAEQCEAVFRRLAGPETPFDPAYLEPAGARSILARLLANLKAVYRERGDRRALLWVLRLRAAIPGVPATELRELAMMLAASGRFDAAADTLEGLEEPEAATRLRARLN
ncbi:MAG: SirB1 family protein [Acidimicrobiales bacterium]